jgi:hypothetical protein
MPRHHHEDHEALKTTKTLCDLPFFVNFVVGPSGRLARLT